MVDNQNLNKNKQGNQGNQRDIDRQNEQSRSFQGGGQQGGQMGGQQRGGQPGGQQNVGKQGGNLRRERDMEEEE